MGRPFTVNLNRFDPYKTFRFLVYLDTATIPVAGMSKVTGLKRTTPKIEYKEGGNALIRKGPGRTEYEAITLERGLTHDKELEEWANATQVLDKGAAFNSLDKLRKQVVIVMLNEANQPVHRYIVHRCWVTEYQALPDLDASTNAVAIEHIKLEHEGWEHDLALAEPKQQ